jgi:prepilin-type N-terminal cleavage/methylation domain-containing protein
MSAWRVPGLGLTRQGMTLVELVVGLTITGLAFGAGYAAFASLLDHRERADSTTAATAREAAVRHALVSWLAGAVLVAEEHGPTFSGLDGRHGTVPDSELSFLTTAATPLNTGHTLVRLYIDRDEGTPEAGLVAELMEWRGVGTARIEIERRATGLHIRYLSSIHTGPSWLESWVSGSVLPAAVELTLLAAMPDSLPPLLRLPVLVDYAVVR